MDNKSGLEIHFLLDQSWRLLHTCFRKFAAHLPANGTFVEVVRDVCRAAPCRSQAGRAVSATAGGTATPVKVRRIDLVKKGALGFAPPSGWSGPTVPNGG